MMWTVTHSSETASCFPSRIMGLVHMIRRRKSKLSREDVIGNMPDIVITNIMDRLPLQDAVRTSVLSRNWRFKWTMLSQLIFDDNFYSYIWHAKLRSSYGAIIGRLLLHVKGVVTKFVLGIDTRFLLKEDINHWLLLLSRIGTKDLTLKTFGYEAQLMLPSSLFSCLELKRLEIYRCRFNLPPSFHSFPNLLSLELMLDGANSEVGDLITLCPLLETLNLVYLHMAGNVKLVDIAKLENLKVLSLSLRDLNPTITSCNAIFELLGSLPKLEELNLDFQSCKYTDGVAKKRSPIVYPRLKALKLLNLDLESDILVSCFFEMIRSFPNLQTLEITAHDSFKYPPCSIYCSSEMYTRELLQLQSVVFIYVNASDNDAYLIKYLLACSPALKRIVIQPMYSGRVADKRFLFSKKLLKLYCASPLVDIDLH